MSEFNIEVQGGSSVRLPTAGKYCDRDIIVTASGGGTEEIENLIDQSGVLDSTEGTVEEKVEQLVNLTGFERLWYEATKTAKSVGQIFVDATVEKLPRMDLQNVASLSNFCVKSKIKTVDHYWDTKKCTRVDACFYGCSQLEYVKGINTGKATNVSDLFTNCSSLKTIEMPFDLSLATNVTNFVRNCTALEHIRFVAESIKCSISFGYSPLLSAESIQSIIDGLAYVDSTQNLTLSNQIVLTDNQKQVINAKGWTLIQ